MGNGKSPENPEGRGPWVVEGPHAKELKEPVPSRQHKPVLFGMKAVPTTPDGGLFGSGIDDVDIPVEVDEGVVSGESGKEHCLPPGFVNPVGARVADQSRDDTDDLFPVPSGFSATGDLTGIDPSGPASMVQSRRPAHFQSPRGTTASPAYFSTAAFPSSVNIYEANSPGEAATPFSVQILSEPHGADEPDGTIAKPVYKSAREVDPTWYDAPISEIHMPIVATRYQLALLANQMPGILRELFEILMNGRAVGIKNSLKQNVIDSMGQTYGGFFDSLKNSSATSFSIEAIKRNLATLFSRHFTPTLITKVDTSISTSRIDPRVISEVIAAHTHFHLGRVCRDLKHRPGHLLFSEEKEQLLKVLEQRFCNPNYAWRHPSGLDWGMVVERLSIMPEHKLWSLFQMEATGGQPDIVGIAEYDQLTWHDCSPYSPSGRRNLVFSQQDEEAFYQSPSAITECINGNVERVAQEMGVRVLSSHEYFEAQKLAEAAKINHAYVDYRSDLENSLNWVIPSTVSTGHTHLPQNRNSNPTSNHGRLVVMYDTTMFKDLNQCKHGTNVGFRAALNT